MKDLQMRVLRNDRIAADTFEMVLFCEDQGFYEEFVPGQFVHIKVNNAPNVFLRRPISVHSINPDLRLMTIQYAVKGKGTGALAKTANDEWISMLGPIGRGFSTQGVKRAFLLGGGIGVAPLYTIVQSAPELSYTAFLGYRSRDYVFAYDDFKEHCSQVYAYTDDGTFQNQGFAIDGLITALEQEKPDAIYACGPTPMFRALKTILKDSAIPCQISLEERMGCGLGACLVCACKIQTGKGVENKRVCVDGPVFDISEVCFD